MERSKELAGPGGKLVVIVNNSHQAYLKKGYEFMPDYQRVKMIQSLRCVDEVVLSIDQDRTVCATIRMLASKMNIYAFCKAGDSVIGDNVPEVPVCQELGIKVIDGLGDKIQSSSWMINGALEKIAALKAKQ